MHENWLETSNLNMAKNWYEKWLEKQHGNGSHDSLKMA